MLLSREEAELVFKLHGALMQFVQKQIKGAGVPESAPAFSSLSPKERHEVVKAFLGRLDLIGEVLNQLVTMTDAFCQSRLNGEYAVLCRKLAEKLAAKRPSPLLRGQLATWACGIIRTIGWVNFLDDRSQLPHLKLPVIDKAFGVAESTGQGKAKSIRQLLKIRQFDHRWILPSRWETSSMIWTLQDSHGFMIPTSANNRWRMTYPQCLEGERACPPEDVGGIGGFADYLQAMADPSHERHQEMLDWNGPFSPDAFSPHLATHVMQEGMPDWRKMV
jgi:Domain of unknown function (DUF6398)/Plasmid pRiA4b ORF-3-like protein